MTPAEQTKPRDSSRRRWTVRGMWAVIGIGVLLHWTVRDALGWPTSTFYFGLPRPLLAIIGWLAAGLARKLTRREWVTSLTLAVFLSGWVCFRDVRWTTPTATTEDSRPLRVVVWNAAHLSRGRADIANFILQWDADLIGIVEAGPTDRLALEDWRRRLPGYEIASPQSQALILARGRIELHEKVKLGEDSTAMPASVTIDGQTFDICLVDLLSNVYLGRTEPVRNLVRLLDTAPRRPQIVMGDFNTPPESFAFTPLRQQYRDAFDTAGTGYRPTWPFPIPLLKLDYVWVGPQVTVQDCQHRWTTLSDHKPVFTSVRITTTATAPPNSPNP